MSGASQRSRPAQSPSRRRLWTFLPVVVFVVFAMVLVIALRAGDPSRIPSALVGKPAPALELAPLQGLKRADGTPSPGFGTADLSGGGVTIVNVWASWCGPCRAEHPVLMDLAGEDGIRLVGINYKDATENARRFLGTLGNPFDAVGVDADGRAAIDWGVYGVPETFVVDARGVIRLKHVGPLSREAVENVLRPAISAAAAPDP